MVPVLTFEDGIEVEYERFDSLRWIRRQYYTDTLGCRAHHWGWVDVANVPKDVIRKAELSYVGYDWSKLTSRPKRIRKIIRS